MAKPVDEDGDDVKARVRELVAELKSSAEKLDDKAKIEFLIEQMATMSQRIDVLQGEITAFDHFMKARDVILDRFVTTPVASLPSSVVLAANEFVDVSDGMYSLEYGEDGTAYRWTRATPPARFSIWIDRSLPIRVKLTVVSMGRVGKNDRLKLDVDGHLYELRNTGETNVLNAGPLPIRTTNGPTDLLLVVPAVFDPSSEGSADKRSLGIALSRLEAYAPEPVPAAAAPTRSRGKSS